MTIYYLIFNYKINIEIFLIKFHIDFYIIHNLIYLKIKHYYYSPFLNILTRLDIFTVFSHCYIFDYTFFRSLSVILSGKIENLSTKFEATLNSFLNVA